jgi:hypothetical protein
MRRMRRQLVVVVAILVLIACAGVLAVGTQSRTHASISSNGPDEVAPRQTTSSTVPPAPRSSTAGSTTTSLTATATTPSLPLLFEAATGADVRALQARLVDLGFWLGTENGRFGAKTEHAVVAFQKANSLERDGIVGLATRSKLATATRLVPRSTSGHLIEIDLDRQLLLDVEGGRTKWVFDTSTGSAAGSTPVGHWHVYDEVDDWVYGALGVLYRPKAFRGNVAIHGNPSVPPINASHGCVRVINEAMDWLWASGDLEVGTDVWVY